MLQRIMVCLLTFTLQVQHFAHGGNWIRLANQSEVFSGAFSSLTGTPTTLTGYGITDAAPLASPTLTGTPTHLQRVVVQILLNLQQQHLFNQQYQDLVQEQMYLYLVTLLVVLLREILV